MNSVQATLNSNDNDLIDFSHGSEPAVIRSEKCKDCYFVGCSGPSKEGGVVRAVINDNGHLTREQKIEKASCLKG